MSDTYSTERLLITPLSMEDSLFIKELVNTPEWIRFIGNRNVATDEDAKNYVQRILNSLSILYWTVRLKETDTPIGVITFLKKEYLTAHDIGFAFLSRYAKNGYAFEAASVILKDKLIAHNTILATSIKDNVNSIQLLEKLGFRYTKDVVHDRKTLSVYSIEKSS